MKILFAIKSLDVPGGGAERVLTIVASGLAEKGHEVSVLTFDSGGGKSFYPLHSGVQRISVSLGPTAGPTGFRPFMERLPALRRAVRRERPDVVVGFMHSMFVPLAFATMGTGIPLVASEHIVPQYYRGRGMEYTLFKAGCRLSKRVTVLSEAVRELYPPRLRRKMVPMPNPVVDYQNCVVDPVGAAGQLKTVLSVGRLEHQKDHATWIEAFATIADRFPDWRVRIIGDGSLRGDLESAVNRLGVGERVVLPGSSDRIEEEYARVQLVAVPSRFESFGMVTAEALAVGLPVVGFADCPGTNELIRHDENGWLVGSAGDKDRVEAFAEGLEALMSDPSLRARLGAAGPPSVRDNAPDVVVSGWEDLLTEVSRKRN